MRHRLVLPLVLIAGTILVPAIGASAQGLPVTTTTITVPTTTTTELPVTTTSITTTTTELVTTTTTEATTTTTTGGGGGGSLSISAPSSATLSSGTATNAGTLSSQLGAVTVQDSRGAVNGAWTVTVTASSFVTGGASASETIARANVSYWSGAPTDSAGVGVFTAGQLGAPQSVDLSVPRTAFSMASGVGSNSVTWNPTVVVTIPGSAVVGAYTGTITHSAA